MTLSGMSSAELHDLKKTLEYEIAGRRIAEKAIAKKKIMEIARLHGVSLEGLAGAHKDCAPVAAKYANPAQGRQTWTGRDRQLVWAVQLLASSKSLGNIKI